MPTGRRGWPARLSAAEGPSLTRLPGPGRKNRCHLLLDLLKKFHSCRGRLSSTVQRAEQALKEQASYMSKEHVQRSIAKVLPKQHTHTRARAVPRLCLCLQVSAAKEELAGLGTTIEEMRAVGRQLQAELKESPGCGETCFGAEADALVDAWLDVSLRHLLPANVEGVEENRTKSRQSPGLRCRLGEARCPDR